VPKQVIVDPTNGTHVEVKQFQKNTICARCMYLIVTNGAITDVKLKGSEILQLSVSGGSVHQFDVNKKEVPLQIPNVYSPVGATVSPQFQALFKENTPIRGLVIEDRKLKGIIGSQPQLPFEPARIPYIRILSSQARGIPATEPGGTLTVLGEGFAPSARGENPLQLRFGEQIVATNVVVAMDGTFKVQVKAKHMPGDYPIVAEQKERTRTSIETAYVKVVTQDRPGPKTSETQ
jgi:hypothetical protein